MKAIEAPLCLVFLLMVCVEPSLAEEVVLGNERLAVRLLEQDDFAGSLERWRAQGRGHIWIGNGRGVVRATIEMVCAAAWVCWPFGAFQVNWEVDPCGGE